MASSTYAPIDIIAQPPAVVAKMRKTSTTSKGTGWNNVEFSVVDYDTDQMADLTNNRFIIRTPGRYRISGAVTFSTAGSGARFAAIAKNQAGSAGIGQVGFQGPETTNATHGNVIQVSSTLDLVAGDYIYLGSYHEGGSVNIGPSQAQYDGYATYMEIALQSGNANGVPSGARIRRSTSWSLTASSVQNVPLDFVESDTDAMWNSGTSTRVYARKAGWYIIETNVTYDVDATGHRSNIIRINGTNIVEQNQPATPSGAGTGVSNVAVKRLLAGDYVEVAAWQNRTGGTALNVLSADISMVCITGTTVSTRDAPSVKVRRDGTDLAFTAASGFTAIPWNALEYDSDGIWNPSDPTKFTCRTSGKYRLYCNAHWYPNGDNNTRRQLSIMKNGLTIAASEAQYMTGEFPTLNVYTEVILLPGDIITMEQYHSSSGSIGVRSLGLTRAGMTLIEPMSQAALMAPEALHVVGAAGEPAFQNSHIQYNGFTTVGFWKDPFGVVRLQGLVNTLSLNSTIFTLPVGYRPLGGTAMSSGVSNNGMGRINVATSGTVQCETGSSWVNLDNVTFRTT